MKKHLQGRRFVSSDEVKGASQEALREFVKNGFQKLYKRWHKCTVAQREYLKRGCAWVLRTNPEPWVFYTVSPNVWIIRRMSHSLTKSLVSN
ncbi:hypothetical protein TNCV_820221 [Trichonephila clavipes]|nr:hypothetical protein TNCV_820221 [Trichonephila clavipes]